MINAMQNEQASTYNFLPTNYNNITHITRFYTNYPLINFHQNLSITLEINFKFLNKEFLWHNQI